jgi:hypothetical protein
MWGLPDPVVQAVLHHHQPRRLGSETLHTAGILHIADCLHHVLRTGGGEREQANVLERLLDREWLDAVGCSDMLEPWCERTRALGIELVTVAAGS